MVQLDSGHARDHTLVKKQLSTNHLVNHKEALHPVFILKKSEIKTYLRSRMTCRRVSLISTVVHEFSPCRVYDHCPLLYRFPAWSHAASEMQVRHVEGLLPFGGGLLVHTVFEVLHLIILKEAACSQVAGVVTTTSRLCSEQERRWAAEGTACAGQQLARAREDSPGPRATPFCPRLCLPCPAWQSSAWGQVSLT